MKIEEAQNLFHELLDQWTAYHNAARELRLKVTEAFANVANGGAIKQSQAKSSELLGIVF